MNKVTVTYQKQMKPFKAMKALREKIGVGFLEEGLKKHDFRFTQKPLNTGCGYGVSGSNFDEFTRENADKHYRLDITFVDHGSPSEEWTILTVSYSGPENKTLVAEDAYKAIAKRYFD